MPNQAVWRSVLLDMLAGFPQGELTAHRLLPPAEPAMQAGHGEREGGV